ncbi:hypothetical protein [Candidatus Palauibacter sp.]|uniref:hypothetical protein n=1 Tax=Candidatus Palauibacter sp. TaxID=3101350 RepID=UPI003B51EEC0
MTFAALTRDGAYSVTAWAEDNSSPGNRATVRYSFVRDGIAPTFTVSKSQSNIGNTQATRVTVSVGGTRRVAGNKRDLSQIQPRADTFGLMEGT